MPCMKSQTKAFVPIRTFICLTLLLLLTACSSGNTQNPSTTPTASASSKLVPFSLGIPPNALKSPALSNLPASTQLHVVVTFKPNDALLNQLGSSQVNQANQGTDVASLANQLGITDQQYQQVKQFFGVQGASLNLSKLHTTLAIDAQASTFASLLHITFTNYQYQGRTFFAPSTPIMIPEIIAGYIEAISGLDNYSKTPISQASEGYLQPLSTQTQQSTCFPYASDIRSAAQISSAYGFNQLARHGWTGQGTTIILPEFATFSRSDLQFYLSCAHFKGKISYINVDNNPPTDIDVEPLLDIEMVAGLLPNATILVYQTKNTWIGFEDTLNQIASDYSNKHTPAEVSISWGAAEDFMDANDINAFNTTIKTLTLAEHLNVFSASGDCGAYDGIDYPTRDVNFPASDPYALSVGGTELTMTASQTRSQEVVWQGKLNTPPTCENEWGSGGGLSIVFKRPTWQLAPGSQNKYSNGSREVPDISAVAFNIECYIKSAWYYCGGTSAATPIWASAYAVINQGLIATTHYFVYGPGLFYWIAQHEANQHPYYDVLHGNNLYYPAATGFDEATGLGTPNLVGIYNALDQYIKSSV